METRCLRRHLSTAQRKGRQVRLRLKQAFGRLTRRANDHCVFVLLDAMMRSRLKGAFPEDVELNRVGLAEAVAGMRAFLTR